MKKFDLNIEKVLENWEVYHALREIIANALDEKVLTSTKEIEIFKDDKGHWHIRDFGRGLQYLHFTQNENSEKLEHPNLIGRFGVGLKDAMATFDRHGIGVEVISKHGRFTLGKSQKHAFEDLTTLHTYIEDSPHPSFEGTEFILSHCPDEEIAKAKDLFLVFSKETVMAHSQYGDILRKNGSHANIYINGVKVATEENFLFSYNITSLTKAMKKELNRERTNVGRTAYSSRVKQILLDNTEPETTRLLAESINQFTDGTMPDELAWKEVAIHSCKILNANENVVFLTPSQVLGNPSLVDDIKDSKYQIITIPEMLSATLSTTKDTMGNEVRDLENFVAEVKENFTYEEVPLRLLTNQEKEIWEMKEDIIQLMGKKPRVVKRIQLVKEIEMGYDGSPTLGLWQSDSGTILIARSQLKSLPSFAGTLLHELAHASSGRPDVDRGFELELTDYIGRLTAHLVEERMNRNEGRAQASSINQKEPTTIGSFFKKMFT